MIQQKKDIDGKVLTKVSWQEVDPKTGILVLHKIGDIEGLPTVLGKIPSNEQLRILEHTPKMPLLRNHPININALKLSCFDRKKYLSREELAEIKKTVCRARTVSGTTNGDLLSLLLHNMTEKQQAKISVKGYVGPYRVSQDRVIPHGNGRNSQPKAVRVGPDLRA